MSPVRRILADMIDTCDAWSRGSAQSRCAEPRKGEHFLAPIIVTMSRRKLEW